MKKFSFILLVQLLFSCKVKQEEFPLYIQKTRYESGPSCLKMIFEFYNKKIPIDSINKVAKLNFVDGTNLLDLSETVEHFGLKSLGVKLEYDQLQQAPLPAMLFWDNNHFVVLYKKEKDTMYIADPALGRIKYSKKEFCEHWYQANNKLNLGIALLIDRK
jgi:ATP-binding cassette, subfamily B, bacterial